MPPPPQPGPKPLNTYSQKKHQKNLEKFASDLSAVVNASLPSYDKPYGQVAVLAFHWANDDLEVQPLEAELLALFRNMYGFNIDSYLIPATGNPRAALSIKIGQFCEKWGGEDTLMIFVYSGHAEQADASGQNYMLGGKVNPITGDILGPRVNWFHMSDVPAAEAGDVLFVFDSCFSGSAAIYEGPELLAASSWGDVAGAVIETSFTRMLIDELKATNGAPTTVSQIYASIHRNAVNSKIEWGPVHVQKSGKESITLAKRVGPKQQRPEAYADRMKRIDQLQSSEHKVLISVNLQDEISVPDLNEWAKWLTTHVSSRVLSAAVTIEAVFKTSSNIALVTLPVEVWTMLPADEMSYTFISFVQSSNQLPQLSPPAETALAIRPAPSGGRENLPPHRRGEPFGGRENLPPHKRGESSGGGGNGSK